MLNARFENCISSAVGRVNTRRARRAPPWEWRPDLAGAHRRVNQYSGGKFPVEVSEENYSRNGATETSTERPLRALEARKPAAKAGP